VLNPVNPELLAVSRVGDGVTIADVHFHKSACRTPDDWSTYWSDC
jgi:hypothetical protein